MSTAATLSAPKQSQDQAHTEVNPGQQILQMVAGFWVARAMQVAASLKLADHVDDSARSIIDLSTATKTHPISLYRLMRALASVGIFSEDGSGKFRHTTLSRLLRSNEPGSMRAFLESVLGGGHLRAWCEIDHSVRTGETAFDHAHGEGIWANFAKNEHEGRTFNQAMTDISGAFNPAVVKAFDFSKIGTLIDVGGGHGALLTSILSANPHLRGIVFDQPHVVAGARDTIAKAGTADRCETASGNFFESIPAGADACLMKFILHDWNEEKSTQILKTIHAALKPGGRLLVVELVVPPGNEPSLSKWMDLNMLAMTGGRERTEVEFATLFAACGFALVKVHPTESPLSIVEGVRIG
jgi:precorrin-6B methylase 2